MCFLGTGASTHIHLHKLSQRSLRFHAFSFLALFRNQGPLQIIKYGLYTLLRLFIQSVPLVLHNRLFDTALSGLEYGKLRPRELVALVAGISSVVFFPILVRV